MMSIKELFLGLAETLDGDLEIEQAGRVALLEAAKAEICITNFKPLPKPYLDVFAEGDAHLVCRLIAEAKFDWSPPTTSDDPKYIADSVAKAHVELVGPDGLVKSDAIRRYEPLRASARAYHPSMTPHANRTRSHAFMSIYVWYGDVSTKSYVYEGVGE